MQTYPVTTDDGNVSKNITVSMKSLMPGCVFTASSSLLVAIRGFAVRMFGGEIQTAASEGYAIGYIA
jgi:hypothetical protein